MYQSIPKQPNAGFAKRSQNRFLTDNKSDEMMCNVLELYPHKKQYIFQGKEGEMKRKQLYNKVRDKFNMVAEEEEYAEFGKGRLRKKLKKAKEKIGKGLKKVGRAVKTAALAPARGAFLGLLRLNFRGSASRFNLLNDEGEKRFFEKWEKMGGKKDAVQRAIDAGKGKKPLACGKKCRAKAGKNPQLPTDSQSDFANLTGAEETAALIAAGGGVLSTMIKVVGDKGNYKSQIELAKIENDTAKVESDEKKIDASMTPQEAAIADEIIKAQAGGFDAVKAIMENPNLTEEEKNAALQDLKEDMVDGGLSTGKKIGIAVGIIAILGIAFYFINKNKN